MDNYILDGQYGKYLGQNGIRVGEALRKAGVAEDLFSRKRPTLNEADYYRFMDAVGEQMTDPSMPIALATADNIESFSPPVFASYCSKNGRTCIERLSRYKRIIAPMRYEVSENENAGELKLRISASRDELTMSQFLAETEMVFIVHIIRTATKTSIIPLRATMQKPVFDKEFLDYLGCDVAESGENALVFSLSDMERPFISHNEGMWEFFEPELQKRLDEMERDDSFSAKVRSALTELLPRGAGSIDDVAAKLCISKRTLQRKLTEEKTTFLKQLGGTREILAKHYIRNTDMTGGDIAFLLGYQELNSFLRAFKAWTGMSISEYRKKAHIA